MSDAKAEVKASPGGPDNKQPTPNKPGGGGGNNASPGGGPMRGGNRGGGGGGGGHRGMNRGGPRGGGGGFRGGARGGGQMGGGPPSPNTLMGGGGRGGRGSPYGQRGGGSGGPGGRGGGGGDRGDRGSGGGGRRDFVLEKLQGIHGPTLELPPLDMSEKKFSGRARLYIGNLTPDTTEEHLKEIMTQFGEVGEIFFNSEKHFAFLRLASRAEAERAKRELDGQMRNGRAMKVRFAPHQGAVKVTNLGPWVSNELLHRAFSIFGDIERCIVLVDERGRTKGEGLVEFERKNSAQEAVTRCKDGCFFLTSSLRPVVVEMVDETDDNDGMQEKMLPKRNQDFHSERETGPRFANVGSFEYEYGQKWKALYEMKKLKLEALEQEMKLEEDKLIAQMEYAKYEHETEHLRNQLRMREAQRDQQKNQWEERERQMSDRLKVAQERNVENDQRMMSIIQQQEDSMRQRQQENSLFMQAQEISNMLDQQEAEMQQGQFGNFGNKNPMPFGGGGGGGGGGFDGGFGGGFGGNFPGPNFGGPPGGRGGGNFRGRGAGNGDFGQNNKRRRF